MRHRMFEPDDLESYSFSRDGGHGSLVGLGDTTLIGQGNKQQMVKADEKTAALSTNYTDPFAETLKNLQNS